MHVPLLTAVLLSVVCLQGAGASSGDGHDRRVQPAFTPAAGSPFHVGPKPREPVLADFDNDGDLDIVMCCNAPADPESRQLALLLGDGRGGFRMAPGSPITVGPSAHKVAAGDLQNDGNVDVVVARHDSYAVSILVGDGHGGLEPASGSHVPASKGTHPHTHAVTVGDVNADGNLDILTTNASDNNVSVLLGDGTGRFEPTQGSPVEAGRHPYDVVRLHDVNGDGRLDLVTPDLHGSAVTVLLGDGGGGFSPAPGSPFPVGPRPGYVVVGDLDGDHNLDLIATHDDEALVAVLLGDGTGRFAPATGSPIQLEFPVWGASIGDLNRDGMNDLVLGSVRDPGIVLLLGDGRGTFRPAAGSPLPSGQGPGYVLVADVNRDGRLDILSANRQSGDLTVLLASDG